MKRKHRVCVIGDSMLDCYIVGDSPGRTPEANVPLVKELRREYRPGGAANVALNLKAMNVKPQLISLTGNDDSGIRLRKLLSSSKIAHEFIIDLDRQTTVKTRIVDNEFHQFLRLDNESTKPLNRKQEGRLISLLDRYLTKAITDAVIIQDYNKGLITPGIIRHIQKLCKNASIPLLVDPKKENFELLAKCDLFKPNLKECRDYLNDYSSKSNTVCKLISEKLPEIENLVITMADKGLYYKGKKRSGRLKAYSIEHADVSGAGDTVIAALAVFMLHNFSLEEMVKYANIAGALSCQTRGVTAVSISDIMAKKDQ